MPLTLDTPEVSAHGDLDTVLVTGSKIDNLTPAITITYEVGKIESGAFKNYSPREHTIANLPAVMDDMTGEELTPATTDFTDLVMTAHAAGIYYTTLKNLFYGLLQTAGKVGSGTLT